MAAARKAATAGPSRMTAVFTSVSRRQLDEAQSVDIAGLLAVLSDPIRLRLLSIVAAGGEVCSCELEGPLARTQPTISHHTRVLAAAGLLIGERRGRWMFWRVPPQQLSAIQDLIRAGEICASALAMADDHAEAVTADQRPATTRVAARDTSRARAASH